MEHILEALYDTPIGDNGLPHEPDSPVLENAKTRSRLMEQLRAELTPRQNALLDACNDLQDASDDDFSYRKFVYGFRLGAALTLEILQGREALLNS